MRLIHGLSPRYGLACLALAALVACSPLTPVPAGRLSTQTAHALDKAALPDVLNAQQRQQWLDRVTWGATDHDMAQLQQQGLRKWLAAQLTPSLQPMPAAVQQNIDALSISQQSMARIQQDIAAQRKQLQAE